MPVEGEQDLALKELTPLEVASQQALLRRQQETDPLSVSQLATEAASRDQTRASTAETTARLPGVQATSQLQQFQTSQTLMAAAAAQAAAIDPVAPDAHEQWDRIWNRAKALGADDAGQWVGRFTPNNQGRIAGLYSARSPLEALSAGEHGPAGAPGQLGTTPGVDMTAEQIQTTLANISPEQRPMVIAHQEQIEAAGQRVANSANPAAQWDIEATRMGHPEMVGHYSAANLQSLMRESEVVLGALRNRTMLSESGVPEAPLQAKVTEAGGTLYSETPGQPGQAPTIRAVTPQGRETLVATTADGRGVYHNDVTGAERIGDTVLGAKPGTSRTFQFDAKRQAWLDVHPGDDAGALAYANGGAGARPMSPVQIQTAAAARADREVAADEAMGTVPNPAAARAALTAQYVQDYTAAQATAAPGGGGGAAPDPAATLRGRLQRDWQASLASAASASASTRAAAIRNTAVIERQAATSLQPMPNPGPAPPADSKVGRDIAEGRVTVAGNHTAWTKRNGQIVRLW